MHKENIMTSEEQSLIRFLEGKGRDKYLRTFRSILKHKHNWLWLELTHNYIQWLFPLRESSSFAYSISLTDDMVEYIKQSPEILHNIKQAFFMMLEFYGFHYNENTKEIEIIASPLEMKTKWMSPYNHNYLRITRILGCMSIIGYGDLAKKWLDALEDVTRDIYYCDPSKVYWRDAIYWK